MTVQWPSEAIWEAVVPLLPGFTVEVLPEIDSTNTELMRRARAGQMDPVLLVAERQTAGRGRLGRSWVSESAADGGEAPLGALTFSLGLVLQPQDWSGLSLAVGLSLVQSLHPALQLKWPNDIWWNDRKLGGILIETASVGAQRFAVIGVGINVHPPVGEAWRTPPAALTEILPGVQVPDVLQQVVLPLLKCVQRFETEGFAASRAGFEARDLLRDREVECSDGVCGTAGGVDASGALLVHTAGGLKKISSAEVSVRPRS
ncbi:MAG: biotin--[acetyl-CoA-carboxylase] ligase [Burkholderiales bacterium PBB4]|nr:MAG: biotin--[acetyl-CoA-carboxylase] ligase [Burkholderiales bacterium PBB4]